MTRSVGRRGSASGPPAGNRSSPLKWAFGLAAMALLVAAGGVSVFYFNPVNIGMTLARQGLDRSGLEQATVEAPRGPMVYWSGGYGKPIVVLHGIGNQAGSWAKLAADMAVMTRVMVPDLPGHGDSDPLGGALSLQDLVDGVGVLVQKESPDQPVTLMGNAFGGWVALRYAVQHPERVERLILLNPFVAYEELERAPLVPEDREQAAALVRAMSPGNAPTPAGFVLDDLVETIQNGATPRVLSGLRPADTLSDAELAGLDLPVLILWGGEDKILPVEHGERLAQRLPQASFEVLDGCGHIPQQQCPRELVKRLVEIFPTAPQHLLDAPSQTP